MTKHAQFKMETTLSKTLSAWCVVLALSSSGIANAALGESASSIETEAQTLNAKREIHASIHGVVHALTLEDSTQIKEYTNANGQIYAISWIGPHKPNLNLLMGTQNFELAHSRTNVQRSDHKHLYFANEHLIYQARTSNRLHMGKALLIDLAPPNLSIDQVQ